MELIEPGSKIGNYVFQEKVGASSFANVWKAEHTITKTTVGIKTISKSSLDDSESKTRFTREMALQKKLTHPFIAELFQLIEDNQIHYIVMEYAPKGNFLDYVNKSGRIAEPAARRYFIQLIIVLEYLHDVHKICHRDLKAENLLLDEFNNIRVIDFGLTNQFLMKNQSSNAVGGSPAYASPETVKGLPYSFSCDIWSMGVLLYAMCSGELPFDHQDVQKLLQKIVFTEPKYPAYFSPALTDLLKKMLEKNTSKRIDIAKIKEHPWFSQAEYSALMADQLNSVSKSGQSIDVEIVDTIRKRGVDTKNLLNELNNHEFTETTAMYKMLSKEKMTQVIDNVMRSLTGDIPAPLSSSRKAFPGGTPPAKSVVSPIPTSVQASRKMSRPIAVRKPPVNVPSEGAKDA